jgi:hypothetical protein
VTACTTAQRVVLVDCFYRLFSAKEVSAKEEVRTRTELRKRVLKVTLDWIIVHLALSLIWTIGRETLVSKKSKNSAQGKPAVQATVTRDTDARSYVGRK